MKARLAVAGLYALVLLPCATLASAAPAAAAPTRSGVLEVGTVPAVPGVAVTIDGRTATTGTSGTARLSVDSLDGVADRLQVPDGQVSGGRRIALDRVAIDPNHAIGVRRLVLGLRLQQQVQLVFDDPKHRSVATGRLSVVELESNVGGILRLSPATLSSPVWLDSNRIAQAGGGLTSKSVQYEVRRVLAGGADVTNQGQQKIIPARGSRALIHLLFYRLEMTSRDALFGGSVGSGVDVTRPDGKVSHAAFGPNRTVVLDSLARGTYSIRVQAAGLSFDRPVKVSRDQSVALQVISLADIFAVGGAILVVAVALLLLGGAILRRRLKQVIRDVVRRLAPSSAASTRRPPDRVKIGAVVLLACILLGSAAVTTAPHADAATEPSPAATASPGPATGKPTPVFAYYYIWFNQRSWQRAKADHPALGDYSSDDPAVMRHHIQSAKAAGITGFLVSWKHTEILDRRLAQLVSIARQERFSLGIVYEGLDFERRPLPLATIAQDLTYFADTYAKEPVFGTFGSPVVIWTGITQYAAPEVASVTRLLRSRLQVLASAKNVKDYERLAQHVDGEAYYWSSVRPDSRAYPTKLAQFATAVRAHRGLWIAPAAPGFDARLVGGHSVVDRAGGLTLRRELAAARASSPDAVGLISWNEFSENTHVEPSKRYGNAALRALKDSLSTGVAMGDSPDSSSSGSGAGGALRYLPLTVGGVFGALALGLAVRRRRPPRLATGRPQ